MSNSADAARQLIRGTFNGHRNLLTPDPVRYGWSGPYAYEISVGEGFDRKPLYGVTVVHRKEGHMHDLSQAFSEAGEARAYAIGLKYSAEPKDGL